MVKDQGDQPVKKATVQVISEDQDASNYTAVTDAEGHFRQDAIEPGRYRIFIERTGFVEVDKHHRHFNGMSVSLQPGQEVKDLVFRMLSAAVVSGRVIDEDGDPMPNVEVTLLHYGYATGRRKLQSERSERTNDVGEYRMGGVFPGQYFISASPAPDFTMANNKAKDGAQSDTAYATTYYPGTFDRTQAAPIDLHPGDDLPINFSMAPTHTYHIRGSVANPGEHKQAGTGSRGMVMLQPKEFDDVFSAAEVEKDGSFEIRGVAPGSYAIRFMSTSGDVPQTTQQQIDVANSDVNGVRLISTPGAMVHGQVRIEGNRKVDFGELIVTLRLPNDGGGGGVTSIGDDGPQTSARVKNDGTFEMKGVPPGSYTVVVVGGSRSLRDFYLKQAEAGGRELPDDDMRVSGPGNLAMNITLGPGAGVVDGTVIDSKSQPVANAVVVAIPDSQHRRMDRYQRTIADQHGHFTMHGIIPGEYTVLAWDDVEDGAYYDPEFLKRYEDFAEAVHVAENGRQSISVKLTPAGEQP